MREIGEFDQEKLALRFWNYLNQEGIESSLEEDDENNQWSVWVIDEDKLQVALNALKEINWTGNIRELKNIIERLIILSGTEITKNDVSLNCNH